MFEFDFLYTGEDIRVRSNPVVIQKQPRGYEFDGIWSKYAADMGNAFPWLMTGEDIRSKIPESKPVIPRGYEFENMLAGYNNEFSFLHTGADIRAMHSVKEPEIPRGSEFDYIMEDYLRQLSEEAELDDGIYYPGLKDYEFSR